MKTTKDSRRSVAMMHGAGMDPDQRTAWYAIHSKSMAERLAADALTRKGFEAYLPMSTLRVRHARRTQIVSRPLFRRYLFVCLPAGREPFAEVRKTWGVEWLVTNVDKPVRIASSAIDAIRAAEIDGAFDATKPRSEARFKPGRSGPGHRRTVLRSGRRHRGSPN